MRDGEDIAMPSLDGPEGTPARTSSPGAPVDGAAGGGGRSLPVVGSADMDRRHALKIMALAAAAPTIVSCAPGEGGGTTGGGSTTTPAPTSNPMAKGTAWDPDLVAPVVPWERTLTRDELDGLVPLVDVILPADERSPAASQVGAPEFIDEWVSAPYPGNERDGVLIRGGLIWLDRESASRFGDGLRFRDLNAEQQRAICDDICYVPNAPAGYEAAARFFERVRYLASTAFWTTPEGMSDLGYVGNVALAQWDAPPPEVLRHLGLE